MKPIVFFNVLLTLLLGLVPKATALRLDFANLGGINLWFGGNDPTDGVGTLSGQFHKYANVFYGYFLRSEY